jgi:mono/diheme cytochrome c family protein
MQSKIVRIICGLVFSTLVLVNLCLDGVTKASAQSTLPPAAAPKPAEPVVWDALQKESSPKSGDPTAEFVFSVTNVSDGEVIIDHAQGSCSCTVAKLPNQPWHLVPRTNGHINVSVNLAGKSGTLFKTVTVFYSNLPPTILRVTVHVPESPAMLRDRNQKAALADRQLVFKGDCAKCHADPAKDKTGKEVMGKALYVAVCGVCHEANPRATMVSDLHALNHPTNYEYWKQWIVNGKPGTLMPAFATNQGGPLSDKQIVSLAKLLTKAFPSPGSQTVLSDRPIAIKPMSSK